MHNFGWIAVPEKVVVAGEKVWVLVFQILSVNPPVGHVSNQGEMVLNTQQECLDIGEQMTKFTKGYYRYRCEERASDSLISKEHFKSK